MFNPVAPYGYLLPNVYLFMADIASPDLFVCVFVGPGFVSTSLAFMRSSANHASGLYGRLAQNPVNREGLTQCAQQFVTTPLFFGCIVWSLSSSSSFNFYTLGYGTNLTIFLFCGFIYNRITNLPITIRCCGIHYSLEITFTSFPRHFDLFS